MELQVYFEHTPARFAFITAIVWKGTRIKRAPLKDIFRLSRVMVENDENRGFELFSGSLDVYLGQALNDLLDDPQGEYFIDDSQYTDIALVMINYISAENRYVLPIGYSDLCCNIAFQAFWGQVHLRRSCYYGQYFAENPVKIIHSL